MLVLVDTNVLLRLIEPQHAHHSVAFRALRALRNGGDELCVVPQIHYEFWVVATRAVAHNGLGMTTAEAKNELLKLGPPLFRFLRDERAIYDEWQSLVVEYEVNGRRAHDARLVAAMRRHGLSDLLTFNAADFRSYQELTILEPGEVAEQ